MNEAIAQAILDKVVGQVFGYKNPYSLEQFLQKFAFDVRLPSKVNDATTGEETWAQSVNPTKFITLTNARNAQVHNDWIFPKEKIQSVDDILKLWQRVNYMTTERQIESINVARSDNIYNSENVFHSQDINRSKNVIFSDGVMDSEYIVASQRSNTSTYSIRIEDSKQCSGSFSIQWCGKITNCFFMSDCFDMSDSMFCTNITSKRFCIANMQYEEEEYKKIKDMVVRWVLS